jgi:uncharacterized membrane protein YfcA
MLVGLTGVGGGSLMTPLLILLFGVHSTTAVGTDLLYAAATKTTGTLVHGLKKTVDWPIAAHLGFGSIPATVLTILALKQIGIGGHESPRFLTVALGLALVLSAVAIPTRHWTRRFSARHPVLGRRWVGPATVALGAVLGVLVTLTSVGAGALGMTVLVLLYPDRPMSRLVGTDIAHAVPLTLIAGLGHWLLGSVDWALMALLLLGSIPGIIVGSHLSGRIPERVLRPILAATLAVVGVRLIFR